MVRLADEQDDAVRVACTSDERRVGQGRLAIAGKSLYRVGIEHDDIDPAICIGVRALGQRLVRAEVVAVVGERLDVVVVRDAVVVPVIGVDAAV